MNHTIYLKQCLLETDCCFRPDNLVSGMKVEISPVFVSPENKVVLKKTFVCFSLLLLANTYATFFFPQLSHLEAFNITGIMENQIVLQCCQTGDW